MEDFKDVMLSEPPARSNVPAGNTSKASAGGASGGGGASKSNISNSRTVQQTSKAGQSSLNTADTTGADFSAYKGILLCDRPVDRTQLGAGSYRGADGGSGQLPFLPSGKAGILEDRAVGLPPTIEGRSRLEQQRTAVRLETKGGTTSGALARHKRWLKAFAKNVQEITADQKDAEDKRERVRQHIRQKEAAKRAEWFTQPREELRGKALVKTPTPTPTTVSSSGTQGGGNNNKASIPPITPTPPNEASTEQQQQSNNNNNNNNNNNTGFSVTNASKNKTTGGGGGNNNNKSPSASSSSHMRKHKKKPMWAMTEDEELDAEFEGTRDLLDFASALDYNAFAKDIEIQEAMAIMKQRMNEIAAEKKMNLEEIRQQAANAGGGGSDDENNNNSGDEDDDDAMTVVSVMVEDSEGNERKVHQLKPRKKRSGANNSSIARSNNGEFAGADGGGDGGDDSSKPKWDATTKIGAAKFLRNAMAQEGFALAEKLLAENPALRQVHSKYSLARMLQQVALGPSSSETAKNPFGNTAETQGIPFAGRLAPPVISNIAPEAASNAAAATQQQTWQQQDQQQADGGGGDGGVNPQPVHRRILVDLRKRKDQTQNLPYLYRHPGI